jgi:hypothetical protein
VDKYDYVIVFKKLKCSRNDTIGIEGSFAGFHEVKS